MSEVTTSLPRKGLIEIIPGPPSPEEEARWADASKRYHDSAASQINPDIREATPELLARHITELEASERQSFIDALIQQIAPDDLRRVSDALQQRRERGAA